jgi:hypothetical protein
MRSQDGPGRVHLYRHLLSGENPNAGLWPFSTHVLSHGV